MAPPPTSVLVTGAGGRTGDQLLPLLAAAGHEVRAPTSAELDITDGAAVRAAVEGVRPEVVVNLAAWTDLERCEREPDAAEAINGTAVGHLREAAAAVGAHLVHVSTDYVFDGESEERYREDDPTGPLSAYARTKLSGEVHAGPDATVVRTSWLVGVTRRSIITAVLDQAADPDRALRFVGDQWGSPTSATDLAEVLVALLAERPAGVFHGVNEGRASRYDIARLVLEAGGHDPDRVSPVPASDMPSTDGVVRPRDTSLANLRLPEVGIAPLRSWDEAFRDLVAGVRGA